MPVIWSPKTSLLVFEMICNFIEFVTNLLKSYKTSDFKGFDFETEPVERKMQLTAYIIHLQYLKLMPTQLNALAIGVYSFREGTIKSVRGVLQLFCFK